MASLTRALASLQSWLKDQEIPFMVIGGIANFVWGEPRLTQDIDATIQISEEKTEKLIDTIVRKVHEGYISELVIDEVLAAPEPKRTQLSKVVFGEFLQSLPVTEESEKLASEYIKAGAMTEKHKNDASHIAVATLNNLEAIVSWNMDQIVRLSTKEIVDKVNQELGYKPIYICTPREVI